MSNVAPSLRTPGRRDLDAGRDRLKAAAILVADEFLRRRGLDDAPVAYSAYLVGEILDALEESLLTLEVDSFEEWGADRRLADQVAREGAR